jgi:hypothetical protein
MPIRIEILPEYVHVAWYGSLVNEDLAMLGAEMPKIGQLLGKVPNVLHTFDEVSGIGLQFEAMHMHSRHLARIKLPNRSRTASVCNNPLSFGMARMMQSLNHNPDLVMEVFSTMDEALAWLRTPTEP